MEQTKEFLDGLKSFVNDRVEGLEGWQIVGYSVATTVGAVYLWNLLYSPEASLKDRVVHTTFKYLKKVPYVRRKIDQELSKTVQELEKTFYESVQGQLYIENLPPQGWDEKKVLSEISRYKALATVNWDSGACSGTVYSGDADLTKLMAKVYGEFAWHNPLHADVFPDVRKMEAEVVRMTCNMFQGDSETCGSMTSGGTESIMLACKAYRDMAMERGIKHPEMVVPVSAHAAFDKAAAYFRIRIIHTAVDDTTRKADVKAMQKAITRNTCMLAGSAPSFGHGVIDPIVEIAQLGLKYKIPVHVDSCLGGFLVPFMREAGYKLDPFDFSVNGVTSISADTHKYGYAPKGSSVVMYKNKNYRRYQYFVAPDWPGGIYASPTFAGSRAGAIIAACWATMVHIGRDNYVKYTKQIIETREAIEKRLRNIKHIYVLGKPNVSVVAIGSNDFNVYNLSDALTKKGWNLNALQFPSSIHLCATLVHTKPGIADRFVQDVQDCVNLIMKDPKADQGGSAAMYGMAQSLPDRSIVGEVAGCFFDAYYETRTPIKAKGE